MPIPLHKNRRLLRSLTLSIIVSGIAFAAGHAPSYAAAGWLFWKHGLAAAIVAHMLVHAAWLPLDLCVARRATA
ncbi:hypothetical protein QFZ80_007133 [Paenibacillus sp. V4I7]|nr:hypothetical protein [Paenibacillus sp. V4I7]